MKTDMGRWLLLLVLVAAGASPTHSTETTSSTTTEEPPEGYYAFVESPSATPPRVRPPPYRQIQADCPDIQNTRPHVTAHNLCGDLNRGLIPRNPMGQNPFGEPYPFEMIRNQTLKFLSRTLPVLRADDTLPRVAQIQPTAEEALDSFSSNSINEGEEEREKRSISPEFTDTDAIPSNQLKMEHRGLKHRGK